MRQAAFITAIGATLLAVPATAKQAESFAQPAVLKAVLDCRTIADATARLACFDRSAEALETAATSKEVLVVDRDTARKTKRGLFGLTLPKLKLFGEGDDEEVGEIESKIASTYTARDGSVTFVLEDGAHWKQTDGRDTFAKAGQPITVRKGALGSFFARVNNQPGVRVVRVQ